MKIYIDAGHNYSSWNTGAEGNSLREQDITYNIAKSLGDNLKKYHEVDIRLSRNNPTENLGTNQATSLSARYKGANNWGADLFVSIHCNAFTTGSANGTETIYKRLDCKDLATKMSEGIADALGIKNRGAMLRNDLAVLNCTTMPAILIELAFISNTNEAKLLKDKQSEFSSVITKVLSAHYKLKPKTNNTTDNIPKWQLEAFDKLVENGVIKTPEYWKNKLSHNVTVGEMFALIAKI